MVSKYNELDDEQQKNIFYILDKAQKNVLNKFKKFEIKPGKNNTEFRENVLHGLMMEMIDFDFFLKSICQVDLEGNNTLFVYEPDDPTVFSDIRKKEVEALSKQKKINIYDINVSDLDDIALVNVEEDYDQLIFSFVAPSFIVKEKSVNSIPDVEKDLYFAYIILDFKNEHIVLSMHPTHNLYSICGVRKKRDFDSLANHFINYFKKEYFTFNYSDPEWIVDAISEITEDHYDHNNPIITKKMVEFEKEQLQKVVNAFAELEETFKSGPANLRITKSIREQYELHLIGKYGSVPKDTPFKIFLNESGKGITSFKADSRGTALNFADSYEIVKKMVENADISSIGITYVHNGNQYHYKLFKEPTYYSLKRVTTAVTKKEIVDNVLCQLKKYQSGTEFTNTSEEAKDNQ
ncbi:hypothetical protein ACDI16_02035 [Oceanobacillus caeni]